MISLDLSISFLVVSCLDWSCLVLSGFIHSFRLIYLSDLSVISVEWNGMDVTVHGYIWRYIYMCTCIYGDILDQTRLGVTHSTIQSLYLFVCELEFELDC